MRICLLLSFIICFSSYAVTQNPTESKSKNTEAGKRPDTIILKGVLVPGKGILDLVQTQKISFKESNPSSPQEIYNSLPGVFMHAGALNTNRLTIRGIGSRSPFSTTRIRAFINDIPITDGNGETNLEDINLGIIDEIELIKGPSPPSYGTSLGGTLRYRTSFAQRPESSFISKKSIGSFGSFSSNNGLHLKSTKSVFTLNHDLATSDGYRENNNFFRQSISSFGQVLFKQSSFSSYLNFTSVNAEIPSSLNLSDFEISPEKAASNWLSVNGKEDYHRGQIGFNFSHKFLANWETSVSTFYSTFKNEERRPFNELQQLSNTLGLRAKLSFTKRLSRLALGIEIFNEKEDWSTFETLDIGKGTLLSDNEEKRRFINLFFEGSKSVKNWNVFSGLNLNHTNYTYQDLFGISANNKSGEYQYKPILSPYLKLEFDKNFSTQNYIKVYTLISHGFSIPTLSETLNPEGIINVDIEPEIGWNTEIGIRGKYNDWSLDLSLYHLLVTNLLVAERLTEDQYIGINAGKTRHPGIELEIGKLINIKCLGFHAILVNGSFQYSPHQFIEFVNRDIDYADKFLPGNPRSKALLSFKIFNKNLNINWTSSYTSAMFADDLNLISTQDYFLHNLLITRNIKISNKLNLDIIGHLNNIGNSKYASMIAVNPRSFGAAPPRYLYAGLPFNYAVGIKLQYSFD